MLSPPIRRLLALLGPERGRWALVGGLMSASALGEVAAPYFTGRVTERVAQEEDAAAAVWPLLLLGLGSAITELGCDAAAALALTRARQRLQGGAVAAVLRGDVPGPGGGLGDTPGAVAARVTGDAEAAHAALGDALVPGLWAVTRAVALLAAVAALSPLLGLLTLLALPLFLLLPHAVARVQQFPALALKLALLFLGGRLVAAGSVTRGELVTILMCQLNFTRAVEAVLLYVPSLAKAVGSSETLLALLEQAGQGTPAGPPPPVTPQSCDTAGARGLCLKDVWMCYPGRAEPVLKGVSLSLRPGEAVAVLAPPGGGKSSLAAAALGLRPLAGGAVLLNGTALSPRSEPALREQVAGVLQCPSLLSRSLSANIRLGWGHKEGTPVVAAARRAGVHSWAQQLPQGYDTEVGPRGLQLSGGQAQGVALARALLRNPQVLVLDEPTRALDPVTRCQVEQELLCRRGPGQGPAVLLVTARVALAQLAPRVALLEGGRLRELRSPEELRSLPWGTAGDTEHGETADRDGGNFTGIGDTECDTRDGDTGDTEDGDTGTESVTPGMGTAGDNERGDTGTESVTPGMGTAGDTEHGETADRDGGNFTGIGDTECDTRDGDTGTESVTPGMGTAGDTEGGDTGTQTVTPGMGTQGTPRMGTMGTPRMGTRGHRL